MQTVRDILNAIRQQGLTEDDTVLWQFLTRDHLPQCASMTDEQWEDFCNGYGEDFADAASLTALSYDPTRNPRRERLDALCNRLEQLWPVTRCY